MKVTKKKNKLVFNEIIFINKIILNIKYKIQIYKMKKMRIGDWG